MPDKRHHRGPHPDDARLFAPDVFPSLRIAAVEFAWLLSRGYADRSALKLVGDRHTLDARQRIAVMRSACSDRALTRRRECEVAPQACKGQTLGIDGYNLLVTIESALSGGVVLIGRDGCCRDLASMHGTYRRVEETIPAIERITDCIMEIGPSHVDWYLDRPVSNSGRLKAIIAEFLERRGWLKRFNIELVDSPDRVLSDYDGVIVTADGPVIDRCKRWTNLAREIVGAMPGPYIVDLFAEENA